MGCGCGSGKPTPPPSTQHEAPPTNGETWEAVYPNGDTQQFPTEWQAAHAVSMAGGYKRRVTTKPFSGSA